MIKNKGKTDRIYEALKEPELKFEFLRILKKAKRYKIQLLTSILLVISLIISIYNNSYTFAAPEPNYEEVTSDADWNLGALEDISVSSGTIEISGDGGAGWLSGWQKRKPVTITNSGSGQTYYQVRLSVTYDSDMLSDFSDLRFAKSDGSLLDFWLQTKIDENSAIIWVEVDTLAGSADTIVYMYYGKNDATSASNGENTFLLFDDFNDGSIDAGKWTEADPGSKIDEASGQLRFLRGGGTGAWDAGVYAVT